MLQHRVYLLGELGKLRDPGDAEHFIGAVGIGFLAELGLNAEPEGLGRQFADQAAVSAFVASCSSHGPC